jgi:hypothetical protein
MPRATVGPKTGGGWHANAHERLDPRRVRALIRRLDGPVGGWISARRAGVSREPAPVTPRRHSTLRRDRLGHPLT